MYELPSAGPALDRLVGERLFGLHVYTIHHPVGTFYQLRDRSNAPVCWYTSDSPDDAWRTCPKYSTKIYSAWLVVDALTERWGSVQFTTSAASGRALVQVINPANGTFADGIWANGPAPEAICLAALRALDAEAELHGTEAQP